VRLTALAVLLAPLAGCAGASAFRCPANGGPAWRELATDHFVLRTDLPSARAASLAGRLERMRAAVEGALGGLELPDAVELPGRIEVIAFASRAGFEPFAPDGANGYYLRYAGGPPRIVLSGEIQAWQRALLAHELTHHFLAGRFPRQPRWFAEGLAVYMESLGDDPAQGALVVGDPPRERLERARQARRTVRELLAWDGRAGDREGSLEYYASSWLLVHWLVHSRPDAFAGLQRRFAEAEAPDAAWRAVLPEYDPGRPGGPERLDALLAQHARSRIEVVHRTVEVPPSVGYFENALPPAEVHAIRLALWSHGPEKPAAALRAEIDEALSEAPAHPVALQLLATFEGEDPVRLARASTAAHPEDARAWTFLGLALEGGKVAAEREAAYRRALELAPENPAALHNLATELDAQGRPGEALPIARRAARLAPWSPPLLAGYAAILSELGRCAEAIPVLARALDVLPEQSPEASRRDLETKRDAYTAQCAR